MALGNGWSRRGLLLALVISALNGNRSCAAPPQYGPITEQVCTSNSDFSANVLSKLPRVSLFQKGKTVSSDLGSYDIINCGSGSSAISCSLVNPVSGSSGGVNTLLNNLQSPPPGQVTILNYAEPIAWYGILAFVMAILSVLFTIVFIIGRYCCCCCPRAQESRCLRCCCICIQCGAHEPTRRTCLCGVVQPEKAAADQKPLLGGTSSSRTAGTTASAMDASAVPAKTASRRPSGVVDGAVGLNDGPVGISKGFSAAMLMASPASPSSFVTVGSPSSTAASPLSSSSSGSTGGSAASEYALSPASRAEFESLYVYPRLERWLTLALMIVFWLFIFSFTVIGAVLGVEGIPQGLSTAAPRLTNAYMPLVNAVYKHVEAATIGMTSDVVVPQAVSLNATLQSGFSIPVVDSSLSSIVVGIDSVPSTSEIMVPINAVNASILQIKGGTEGLLSALSSLSATQDKLLVDVTSLQGTVSTLSTSLNTLNSNLSTVDTAIVPIQTAQTSLLSSPKLLIDTVSNGVAALVPAASGVHVPTASQISAVTGPEDVNATPAVADSLNAILLRSLNNQASDQQSLKTKVDNLKNQINQGIGLYNYSAIADAATEMNAIALALKNQQILALLAAISATEATLATTPNSTFVQSQVNTVKADADSFSFAPVFTNIDAITAAITSRPSLLQVVNLLERMKGVSVIIPAAKAITEEIKRVNSTLVALPDSALEAFNAIDNANATITSALEQITQVQQSLRDAETQISAFNTATSRQQVQNAQTALNNTLNTFNFGQVLASIVNIPTVEAPVNFTTVKSTLNALSAQLANTGLNATTIDTIRSVEDLKNSIVADLDSIWSDLQAISNNNAFKCSVSGTPCTNTCATNAGYCMPSFDVASRLKANLTALSYATNNGLSAGSVVSTLASMKTSAQAVQTSSYRTSITSAQANIASVDTPRMSTQLAAVAPAISQFDLVACTNDLTNIRNQIAATNINSGFVSQIDSLNSTLNMVKTDARGAVVDIQALLRSVQLLLGPKLRSYGANSLASSTLASIQLNEGFGSVLYAILAVADDAANTILGTPLSSSMLKGLLPAPVSLSSQKILGYNEADINRITASGRYYRPNRGQGLFHWALSSLPFIKGIDVLNTTSPKQFGVFKSASLQPYPSNARCFSDSCIAKSINYLAHDTPIGSAMNELDLGVNNPVPSSVAQGTETINLTVTRAINAVLWVFPSFVLLFGLLGLLNRWICNCRCCYKSCCKCCCNEKNKPKWEKCPYGCMTGCILFQLPICFVLAGLFFPAMMVFGDVCASGRNVGYSALLQINSNPSAVQSICSKLPSSSFSISPAGKPLCSVSPSVTLPSGSAPSLVNVTLDLDAYTQALLGQGKCASASAITGGVNSPWQPAITQLASRIRTVPYQEVRYLLTSPSSSLSSTVKLRPAMLTWAYGATNATADLLATTMENFLGDVASCAALNNAVQATSDVVCCNLVTPLYWLASVFFLIAWGYCCCGLPVGLLARKRLVSRPWGSQVRAVAPTGCCGSTPKTKTAGSAGTDATPTLSRRNSGQPIRRRPSATGGDGAGRYPLSSEAPVMAAAAYQAGGNYGGWGPVAAPDGVGVEMVGGGGANSNGARRPSATNMTNLSAGQSFFASNPMTHARSPATAPLSASNSFAPTAAGAGHRPSMMLAAGGITYSVGGLQPALASAPALAPASAPPAYGGAGNASLGDSQGFAGAGSSMRKMGPGFMSYKKEVSKSDLLQTPAAASSSRNLVPRPSLHATHAAAAAAAAAAAVVDSAGINPVGPGSNATVRENMRTSPVASSSRSSSARSSNSVRSASSLSPGRAGNPLTGVEENPSPLIAAGLMRGPGGGGVASSSAGTPAAPGAAVDIDSAAFSSPGFAGSRRALTPR